MSVLDDLLGTRVLYVSGIKDNCVLYLEGGLWSKFSLMKPRGIAVGANQVAIACKDGIRTFGTSGRLGMTYHLDGTDNIHGAVYNAAGTLVMVSGVRSAVVAVGVNGTIASWTTPGVTPGTDARTYLNGLAVNAAKQVQYLTALGVSNIPEGWRAEAEARRGALIDRVSQSIVLRNLFMPHSPVVQGTTVWFLNSGDGQLCKWNPGDSTFTVVATYDGFARGLCFLDATHVAMGVSQGRSTALPNLTIDLLAQPGILVIDTVTGAQDFVPLDIQEIFDVEIGTVPLSLSEVL